MSRPLFSLETPPPSWVIRIIFTPARRTQKLKRPKQKLLLNCLTKSGQLCVFPISGNHRNQSSTRRKVIHNHFLPINVIYTSAGELGRNNRTTKKVALLKRRCLLAFPLIPLLRRFLFAVRPRKTFSQKDISISRIT